MKKYKYKKKLKKVQGENQCLKEVLAQKVVINCTSHVEESVENNNNNDSQLDFLEQKARESAALQKAKVLSMDEIEAVYEEYHKKLKDNNKQLKDVTKQIKKLISAVSAMDKKYSKLLVKCNQLEKDNKKLNKKIHRLEEDMDLIKKFFIAAAFYSGHSDVGDSFEKIMKKGIKAQKSKKECLLYDKKKEY